MTLLEAIQARHAVRKYVHNTLNEEIIKTLQTKIDECNKFSGLKIQLVTNETTAFTGLLSYGKFHGVENYIAMIGPKSDGIDEKIGYYGEQIVLLAQTLGLNTCWVGMTYKKTDAYTVEKGEKLYNVIALGYGETQGNCHKTKTLEQVSNADATTPSWFAEGVKAALLAPSALNQQKYKFTFENGKVKAEKCFALNGYTGIDLGIAKCHFEIGAGKENFEWQ